MEKLNRPKGLISYSTLASYDQNMRLAQLADGTIDPSRVHTPDGGIAPEVAHTTLRSILRPRTIIYFVIWSLIGVAMVVMLATRDRLELNVLHDRNPVSVTLSDGRVRNGYTVKILNMMPEKRTILLTIEDFPEAAMLMPLEKDEPRQAIFLDVDPDSLRAQRIFVIADPSALEGQQTPFRFWIRDSAGSERAEYDAIFDNGGSR
ncbi:MAG: FixG Ig-like domain-containing protein [Thalassobaculum sp.]